MGYWIDKYKWIFGLLLSAANLAILLLGVTGNWRDKIVVNDVKLEQLTVTVGEIKADAAAARAAAQSTATDMATLKANYTNVQSQLDRMEREQQNLRNDINGHEQRLGVLEQRQRR
jgi:septal ring factor EnvC (AmiA/AmiB activator)